MADLARLMDRIDTEFAQAEQQVKDFQTRKVEEYHGRQQRLELFAKVCDDLQGVWRPRLEALAKKFGDKVQVIPAVTPSCRQAEFAFKTLLAHITLRFSASTDEDVRNLVLDYDLHILPILMKFESHVRAEFPLEKIDVEAVANWFDDRMVDFVKVYLSVHHNDLYLKDHMVVDPIANTRFPKYCAAAQLEWQRQKFYFISEETRDAFAKKNGISV